jgi:serine/threonine-protein kinase RsbW
MHGRCVPGFGSADTGGGHPEVGRTAPFRCGLVPGGPGQLSDVPWNIRGLRDGGGPDADARVPSAPRPGGALDLRRPADPAELRHIRGRVEEWAQRNAVPEGVLIDLQLALGEAVANGVEHAYAGTHPGTVDVHVEIDDDRREPVVAVRVTDHGRWRPVPQVRGYRGRGLTVIERLAHSVVVERTRVGTQVCFEIPLQA